MGGGVRGFVICFSAFLALERCTYFGILGERPEDEEESFTAMIPGLAELQLGVRRALIANELRKRAGVSRTQAAIWATMAHRYKHDPKRSRKRQKAKLMKLLENERDKGGKRTELIKKINEVQYPKLPQNQKRMEEVKRKVRNATKSRMQEGQAKEEVAKPDGWISHGIEWSTTWTLQECEKLTVGIFEDEEVWNHGDRDLAVPEASDLPSCFFPLCTDTNALCMPCNCEQTHRKGRTGQGTLSHTATETSNTTEENFPPQPRAADVISEGHWQRRCRCINPNKRIKKGMLSISGVVNKPLRSYKEAVMECVKMDYREDRLIYLESEYPTLPGTCMVVKSELEEQFDVFAEIMRPWIKNGNATDADKLTLYGFYKQAVDGDCSISPPWGSWAKAKYDAWMERKGLSKVQAMEGYITEAQRQIDTYKIQMAE